MEWNNSIIFSLIKSKYNKIILLKHSMHQILQFTNIPIAWKCCNYIGFLESL